MNICLFIALNKDQEKGLKTINLPTKFIDKIYIAYVIWVLNMNLFTRRSLKLFNTLGAAVEHTYKHS